MIDPSETITIETSYVTARAAYSGGPKLAAKLASAGARRIRTKPPKMPPIAEAEMAMPIALEARPFWAMG